MDAYFYTPPPVVFEYLSHAVSRGMKRCEQRFDEALRSHVKIFRSAPYRIADNGPQASPGKRKVFTARTCDRGIRERLHGNISP